MSPVALKRLIVALGILVFGWVAAEMLRGGSNDGTVELSMPDISPENTDSIVVDRESGRVALVRVGDSEWTVNGYRAGFSGISELFAAFGGALHGQLAAQNPETHSNFEIGDAAARRVRVYQSDSAVADLLIGKRSGDRVYVRRPDENEVYSVRSALGSLAMRQINDWRDRVIVALEPDSVAEFEVTRDAKRYSLRRSADAWIVDGAPADTAAVGRLLNQYRALNATGFPNDSQQVDIDFSAPERVIRLGVFGGSWTELRFDSTSAGFWVQRLGDSTAYRLDQYRVNQLVPLDTSLVAKDSPTGE